MDVTAVNGLSGDQLSVLGVLAARGWPMTPAQVAEAMGAPRTPAGAGQTLASLHRHGLVKRQWGETTAMFWVNGDRT